MIIDVFEEKMTMNWWSSMYSRGSDNGLIIINVSKEKMTMDWWLSMYSRRKWLWIDNYGCIPVENDYWLMIIQVVKERMTIDWLSWMDSWETNIDW